MMIADDAHFTNEEMILILRQTINSHRSLKLLPNVRTLMLGYDRRVRVTVHQ